MSELRYDPIRKSYSVVAPERGRRLDDFIHSPLHHTYASDANCPFCNKDILKTHYEIFRINKNGSDEWALKVIPNRYPTFSIEGKVDKKACGYYDTVRGVGAHEILIDSLRHGLAASDYTAEEIYNLFLAFKIRMLDLERDIRFRYFVAIKNIGADAGALINHPHAQLIATPIIPPRIQNIVESSLEHYKTKERCLICDTLEYEMESRKRIIYENYEFIAVSPFSSSAFEVHIYPKHHMSSMTFCNDQTLCQLADIVKEIYARLGILLDNPALSLAIISAPPSNNRLDPNGLLQYINESFHWYLEIKPIIMRTNAFELATGININPVMPEECALYLKEVTIK